MPCHAIPCNTMQCNPMSCHVIRLNSVWNCHLLVWPIYQAQSLRLSSLILVTHHTRSIVTHYTRSIVTNFPLNTSPLRWSFGGNKPFNICPFAFPFPIFKRQLRNWGISFVVLSTTLIYFSLNFISFIHAAGNMNLLLWILSNKTNVNRFSSRLVISGILVENIARIANAVQCHSLSLSICWSGLLSWSLWTDV